MRGRVQYVKSVLWICAEKYAIKMKKIKMKREEEFKKRSLFGIISSCLRGNCVFSAIGKPLCQTCKMNYSLRVLSSFH